MERELVRRRREAFRRKNRWRERNDATVKKGPWGQDVSAPAPKPPDAADQLRIVMGARFTVQPLLNKSEARVFRELDQFVLSCNPSWQVMAQVSLGEILRCKDADAYRCINSNRDTQSSIRVVLITREPRRRGMR